MIGICRGVGVIAYGTRIVLTCCWFASHAVEFGLVLERFGLGANFRAIARVRVRVRARVS